MKNVIKILLITILLICIVGCAQFRRLDPQYPLPNQSMSYQPGEGKTKIIFFNGSNFFLHVRDTDTRYGYGGYGVRLANMQILVLVI